MVSIVEVLQMMMPWHNRANNVISLYQLIIIHIDALNILGLSCNHCVMKLLDQEMGGANNLGAFKFHYISVKATRI